jgi:hypothetical protein
MAAGFPNGTGFYTPRPAVEARFRAAGVATFENQTDAIRSLGQIAAHRELLQNRS